MFTFHWSELLVVVLGGIVLFIGLALLMLRRRNEVLQLFLTPEEPDLEEEFFRVHAPEEEEEQEEMTLEVIAESENEQEPSPNAENVSWGTV